MEMQVIKPLPSPRLPVNVQGLQQKAETSLTLSHCTLAPQAPQLLKAVEKSRAGKKIVCGTWSDWLSLSLSPRTYVI